MQNMWMMAIRRDTWAYCREENFLTNYKLPCHAIKFMQYVQNGQLQSVKYYLVDSTIINQRLMEIFQVFLNKNHK